MRTDWSDNWCDLWFACLGPSKVILYCQQYWTLIQGIDQMWPYLIYWKSWVDDTWSTNISWHYQMTKNYCVSWKTRPVISADKNVGHMHLKASWFICENPLCDWLVAHIQICWQVGSHGIRVDRREWWNLWNVMKTRKRGKAQRVAHLVHANITVHFLLTYRQAMLLPPSEWRLKISP